MNLNNLYAKVIVISINLEYYYNCNSIKMNDNNKINRLFNSKPDSLLSLNKVLILLSLPSLLLSLYYYYFNI